MREFVQDGFLKIVFVRSEDNRADIFTKNVNSELNHRHATTMVATESYLN